MSPNFRLSGVMTDLQTNIFSILTLKKGQGYQNPNLITLFAIDSDFITHQFWPESIVNFK